jgi:hypothetical protein
VKHFKDDDQANGTLAKVPKIEDEGKKDGERLTRVTGLFSPGKEPPVIKPKPKPKTRPRPVQVIRTDQTDAPNAETPGSVDPSPIKLSADSLMQFGEVVDLDAVVRYQQLLDNTPQKDRAALSQSKGLKDRRLPSHVASLVGDERPPQRQPVKRPLPQPRFVEEPDAGVTPTLTDEEKRQKLMAKVGISQGNPLAALGNILRKGPNRGSGRDSKSPRREHPVTKKSSFKGSKESLRDGAKDSPELTRRTSEPKSPKMFRFGIRRSSSRSKKGERDDSASDTSSVNSLILSVKEGPMEAESSGLTVSRSAVENEEKEDHLERRNVVDEAALSTSDTSKSGNRNSTYFKPPDVEPLSDLFASGELDALLKTNDRLENATPTESMETEEVEKVEKEDDIEEQTCGGNGLKRSNLRSSFRMYENRYRAETLERKKDKSPLSSSVSTAAEMPLDDPKAVQSPSSCEQKLPTSTPKVRENQGRASADDDTFRSVSPVGVKVAETKSQTTEDSHSEEKQRQEKENERRRRKLFDDELFQSDLSTRAQSRAKKASATAPSLDAYAQAHKSPPPVAVKVDRRKDEKKSDKDSPDLFVKSVEIGAQMSSKQTKREKSQTKREERMAKGELGELHATDSREITEKADQAPHSSFLDGVETDLPKIPNEEQNDSIRSVSSTHSKSAAPLVIEKTELEKESEKREADKEANMKRTDLEELNAEKATTEDDSLSPEGTLDAVDKQENVVKAANDESEIKTSPEKTQSESLNEKVANRIRKRREEREEQKSSRSTRSYDTRSKIESGKVSSARSMFDSSSPSASPRVLKTRAAAETSRPATERKVKGSIEGTHSASPSVVLDLQKRRDQRADRAKEKTTTRVQPSSKDGEEDMPDWRKRIYERRRKAAEASAKGSSVASQSKHSSASPQLGQRHGRVSARMDKSPQKDLSSDVTKSPSSRSTNRTARSTTKEKPETVRRNNDTTTKLEAAEETDSKTVNEATSSQGNEKLSLNPDLGVDAHSELISETATKISSPKPEITSQKPDIQIRKVEKSSSSEPLDEVSSIDTKPPVSAGEGEENKKNEEAEEDEVFPPDAKKGATSESTDLQSSQIPSNLPGKVLADSQSGAGPRRSSNSSEQEVGVPFRSRSISRSRSPTPTSITPGPLKLPTDPGVPEWKKKMLERKKNSTSSRKQEPTSKISEPVVPAWKKELLAKKSKSGEEAKLASRLRSSTVPTRPLSSTRSGRKKEEPEFMKEFKNKRKSTN